jgi:hypothetical protein
LAFPLLALFLAATGFVICGLSSAIRRGFGVLTDWCSTVPTTRLSIGGHLRAESDESRLPPKVEVENPNQLLAKRALAAGMPMRLIDAAIHLGELQEWIAMWERPRLRADEAHGLGADLLGEDSESRRNFTAETASADKASGDTPSRQVEDHKAFEASAPPGKMDATWGYPETYRDSGQFGSHASHDDYSDESSP